ncbi:hypothetical protein ACLKA6_004300 [Drosophila palustris]
MNADQKIDALIELVKKQQEQIKILADQIANQTVLIRQILTERSNSEELLNIFPLEKEEDMLRLEDEISPETRFQYVTAMKKILAPVGIKKGLPRILSADIMGQYNIHGVKQKKDLYRCPNFTVRFLTQFRTLQVAMWRRSCASRLWRKRKFFTRKIR